MSLSWEPRWVRVKLEYAGIRIETCKDLVTGMILCPICADIERICPEGKETNITEVGTPTFFTVIDLINHMRTHGTEHYDHRIKMEKKGR